MSLSNVAFKIFGERLRLKGDKYIEFQKALKQAQMPISYEMYMSSVYLYSLITGIIGAVVGIVASYIYVAVIGLPEQMTKIQLNPKVGWLLEYREIFVVLIIMLVCVAGVGGVTYLIMRITPSMKASGRKSSINKILPYAVTFMYALSRGGMNLVEVFKALANSSDTYGEISKEAASIITDMEYFGYDMRTAIQRSIESTPSPKFQDLMHSLLTVIDSGGNIVSFFSDKSEEYLEEAVVEQQGFLATLELIAESYVTAFVAGPLFIIVIQTVMSVMGSSQDAALYAIIYAMIPIGSVAFVFMIYIMTPAEMGGFVPLESTVNYESDVEILEGSEDEELSNQLEKDKKGLSFKHALKHPIRPIKENPLKVLIISGPIGLIFLMFGIYMNIGTPELGEVIDDYLIFMTFIMVIPLVFFYEGKKRKENKVKKQFPEFLHKLAITNEIGMTLPQSIEMLAKSDKSSMSPEIKKIWNDIDWGLDISEAFIRFANRLKMASIGRTVTLLTRAFSSSGDITDVLNITSKDARITNTLEKDRSVSMLIYVVIIFMAFMVFTIVILILSTSFLPVMAEAGGDMGSTGQGGGAFMGAFDPEFYNRIFFHAAILQGFSSGLVAGQMGEGKVLSGLKYSMIMMAIAYVIFTVAI